jgi:hypothetical protein
MNLTVVPLVLRWQHKAGYLRWLWNSHMHYLHPTTRWVFRRGVGRVQFQVCCLHRQKGPIPCEFLFGFLFKFSLTRWGCRACGEKMALLSSPMGWPSWHTTPLPLANRGCKPPPSSSSNSSLANYLTSALLASFFTSPSCKTMWWSQRGSIMRCQIRAQQLRRAEDP